MSCLKPHIPHFKINSKSAIVITVNKINIIELNLFTLKINVYQILQKVEEINSMIRITEEIIRDHLHRLVHNLLHFIINFRCLNFPNNI